MTPSQDRAAPDRNAERNHARCTGPAGPDNAGPADSQNAQVLTRGITVQYTGSQGWMQVTGELDGITRRHLDDLLAWLINAGATRITVSLLTAEEIDRASIVVLQVAHAQLRNRGGQLVVIAPAAARAAAGTRHPNRPRMFGPLTAPHRLSQFPIFTTERPEASPQASVSPR